MAGSDFATAAGRPVTTSALASVGGYGASVASRTPTVPGIGSQQNSLGAMASDRTAFASCACPVLMGRNAPCASMEQTPKQRSSDKRQPTELVPLIDVSQLAVCLGVEERHIYRLVDERRIPFIKWGRLLRFDPVEIRQWLDARRVQPFADR